MANKKIAKDDVEKSNVKKGGKKNDHPNKRRTKGRDTGKTGEPRGRITNNDLSWYAPDANYLTAVASLPFNDVLGQPIPLEFKSGTSTYNTNIDVPGFCTLYVHPTMGSSKLEHDIATTVARKIYATVVHDKSGTAPYDAPDLFMYLMAMDNAYMLWSTLVRIYGLITKYSSTNTYYPSSIMKSMNINYDDVKKRKLELVALIDDLALQLASRNVPAMMSYFARHNYLFQNVFKDRESNKSQDYIFMPEGFYKFDATASTTGTSLTFKAWHKYDDDDHLYTIEDIEEFITDMIRPIMANEDIGRMSGHILNAFGEGALFTVPTLPTAFTLAPIYDEAILDQIANATIYNLKVSDAGIRQDSNGVICNSQLFTLASGFKYDMDQIVNIRSNNPTPADVMYATRLQYTIDAIGTDTEAQIGSCGSEIITKGRIWKHVDGELSFTDFDMFTTQVLADLLTFDVHPTLYNLSTLGTPSAVYQRMDNVTTVDPLFLKRLHRAVISTMFGLPQDR